MPVTNDNTGMSEPIASVLMPVYRTPGELFRQAAESILNQSLTELELIIVEDPSDRTCEAEVLGLQDDRIRYVLNRQRIGLVAQRNLALSLTRGQFVAKADSDDISEPYRLQTQCDYLSQHPAIGVVGSALTIIDQHGRVTGRRDYPTAHGDILRTFRRRNPIAQPAACFRRDLYLRFGGYPDGYPVCQDYAYWSQLANQGVQFANLDQPLVRYRQHAGSIKATRLRETLDATIQIKRTYWGDALTAGDKLRLLGEHCLRHAPPWLVTRLFAALTYQRANADSQQ